VVAVSLTSSLADLPGRSGGACGGGGRLGPFAKGAPDYHVGRGRRPRETVRAVAVGVIAELQ